MAEHIAFPSIEQFRHVIREVQHRARWAGTDENGDSIFDRTKPLPTLNFSGTVKLHGTNASVVLDRDEIYFQSRNNIITPESDNAGFATWASNVPLEVWRSVFPTNEKVVIYGEWCGKNIQKGVAISELPKMFVIFKILVDGKFIDFKNKNKSELMQYSIYGIHDFPTFSIDINFNSPELSQNILCELTEQVEKECPVGKQFGVSGVGEGIVWSSTDPDYFGSKFNFKVKGEKHSASKVKTLAAVDAEKVASLNDFASKVVTENRCLQGVGYLREQHLEVSEKSTGQFLRWLFNDVMKEEIDTIESSNIDPKNVSPIVSKYGKTWFFAYLNENND